MTLTATGAVGVRLRIAAVLMAAVVAIAFLKPWGSSGPASPPAATPKAAASIAASPASSGSPQPSAPPVEIACLTPDIWRVIGQEHENDQETRRWLAVTPARASGPLASGLPQVRLYGLNLVGFGYCAPDVFTLAGPPTIYRISADGKSASPVVGPLLQLRSNAANAVELFLPPVVRVSVTSPQRAQLFQAPAGAVAWPPGTYVVKVPVVATAADRTPTPLWFAVDITASLVTAP